MTIVTKQGDKGKTRLFTGEEVQKDDPRLEAVGTLDELVSQLGLARALVAERAHDGDEFGGEIETLQRELFRLGAELASTQEITGVIPTSPAHVKTLEERLTALESQIALPHAFIVPGATVVSAALDLARAITRRLERRIVTLAEAGAYANRDGLILVNRLSDYLFLLARSAESGGGCI
jgi:cob(I)alamin adenosyltransferase